MLKKKLKDAEKNTKKNGYPFSFFRVHLKGDLPREAWNLNMAPFL